MKMIFLCLEPLPLKTIIKLCNNKTKAHLLIKIKGLSPRLLLLSLLLLLLLLKYVKWETLYWTKKVILLKISTDLRYCERLTISLKQRDPIHSWADMKYSISKSIKQFLMCNTRAFCIYQTLLRNLADNQINQTKNIVNLILRLFCPVMALSCNNVKSNMITKKKL